VIGHSDRIGTPSAGVGTPPFGVRRRSPAIGLVTLSLRPDPGHRSAGALQKGQADGPTDPTSTSFRLILL